MEKRGIRGYMEIYPSAGGYRSVPDYAVLLLVTLTRILKNNY